jgi:prepilin-type N-terminal cleavage/methylation domain-containing protein
MILSKPAISDPQSETGFFLRFHMSSRGVTIVELAVVLVILGILVGLGANLMSSLTKRAKTIEARDTVNASIDALTGYAVTNSRVPTLAQFSGVVRTPNDAWGNPLQYIFDNNLATSICDRTTTNVTVRVCSNAACSIFTAVNNVAFIVLSGGGNYNNQTAGGQAILAATTVSTYQAGLTVDIYAGDFLRATDEYDDVIKWVTLPELQTKLSCGRCSAYEVWNNLGAIRYFRVNGVGCSLVANNTLIASVAPGGSINGYTDAACSVPAAPATLSYTQATVTDINKNCAVNFTNTDR